MNIRGVGSTVLTLALVLGAAACNDDPTSEGRDQGEYMYVNPVNTVVEAGDTTVVIATVMNRYHTPTNQAVEAQPCDGKITAVADPRRTDFESPETFLVMGQTLGFSCLIVRGGGITDTAIVRVVPARLELVGDTVLGSGETVPLAVNFLNVLGQSVTGFDISAVTFATGSSTIAVIDAQGNVTAQAPGTTPLIVRLNNTWGVARVDTLMVRVQPGTFAGTVAQSTAAGGQILTFTEGALAFDADTKVQIVGAADSATYLVTDTVAGTVTAAVPYGTPSGTTLTYNIVNIGSGQVAVSGTFTTTAAANETWTGTDDPATAPVVTKGSTFVGQLGDTDDYDLFKFTVATAGSYTLQVDWNNGSDVDIAFANADWSAYISGATGWTAANPEKFTVTLNPGTYTIEIYQYEAAAATTQYRVRFK